MYNEDETHKVLQRKAIFDTPFTEVLALRFDPDDTMLAVGI